MRKVAFITGAAGYIGSECAMTLAAEGIAVAVCDIQEEGVRRVTERIRAAGGIAEGYVADVTNPADIGGAIERAADTLGGLDIMVHVAGGSARIAGGKYVPLVEQNEAVIDRVIQVNLYGAIWASRAAAKIMMRQGRGGKILNFSSAVSFNGLWGSGDYAASKGGINSLTKTLAKELGPYKINVNAVAPGVVMRPEEGNDPHRAFETNLLGEKCTAGDIAALVSFLCSDKARMITGQVYLCDGGRTLSMKGSD